MFQTANIVQCFMRFTVELRVKDLEVSVYQTMHKQVLKIRSLILKNSKCLRVNP